MDLHRVCLTLGVVVGLQMMVTPSSIAHVHFLRQANWANTLKSELTKNFWDTATTVASVQSSQRQVNTITLDRADLSEPHELTLETSANLSGQIEINGETVASLSKGTTTFDVAPYLTETGTTTIQITGNYSPRNAAIRLQFVGPSVLIEQQTSGMGQLNYQLNLEVN